MTRAWLFSPRVDLLAFGGSAALSFAVLAMGWALGMHGGDTPTPIWLALVVFADVAHVWSTLYRTYLDPAARARFGALLIVTPLFSLAFGVALYAAGSAVFWRALAYLAMFHFVRQQYGWMALYRARAGDGGAWGRGVDTAAIYAATLYPLVYWHTHLPRRFSWFVAGDVLALPSWLHAPALALFAAAMGSYVVRALHLYVRGAGQPGKDVLVASTASTWLVGIVLTDSDFAFTVTNVVLHAVPYLVLVQRHATSALPAHSRARRFAAHPVAFLAPLWLIAAVEEALWDRAVWRERPELFGEPWAIPDGVLQVLVPLLTVPQLTHYIVDGFVWRRGGSTAALGSARSRQDLSLSHQ